MAIKDKEIFLNMIPTLNECECFLMILNCDILYLDLTEGVRDGIYKHTSVVDDDIRDIDDIKMNIFYIIKSKYGIDSDSSIIKTGDYWKWYDHWLLWYQSLTNDEIEIVLYKSKNHLDFSDLWPKIRWNGTI
jgi:hypothetical protein